MIRIALYEFTNKTLNIAFESIVTLFYCVIAYYCQALDLYKLFFIKNRSRSHIQVRQQRSKIN